MASNKSAREPFVFQTNGVDHLKLCVDITLYFVGTLSDHSEGIRAFYDRAMNIIRSDVVQYVTGTMSRPRRIKADTFDMLPLWVSDVKSKQNMMQLRLDNSTGPDSAADRAFQFVYFDYSKAGAVRLVLPAAYVDVTGGAALASLAQSLASDLRFSSGLGGYSLNWNRVGDLAHEAKNDIHLISRRYPGIDVPDVTGDIRVISTGIKCVNWLTLLDNSYVERLNGVDRLRQTLSSEVITHPLTNGVMIQAGPQPETGDVNRRQTLPLYHSVGRAVAKLRVSEHLPFIPDPKDEQATQKWLARFDA